MTRQYRTAGGKVIEIDAIISQQDNTVSVGNMRVNGRGDVITGGKVTQTSKDRISDYYHDNPRAVRTTASIKSPIDDVEKKEEVVKKPVKSTTHVKRAAEKLLDNGDIIVSSGDKND